MRERSYAPISSVNAVKDRNGNHMSLLNMAILFVCVLIVFLFVYLCLNPEKRGAELRNEKRISDMTALLTTLLAYSSEVGEIPEMIPVDLECAKSGHEICSLDSSNCSGMIDFSILGKYEEENIELEIPIDPLKESSEEGSGYFVSQNGSGEITICAPYAERNENISLKRYVY